MNDKQKQNQPADETRAVGRSVRTSARPGTDEEKRHPDPGRTPGQAEGTKEEIEEALGERDTIDDKKATDRAGFINETSFVARQPEPGRTPGQAEGTEEDVESALAEQESDNRYNRRPKREDSG